MRLLYAFFVIFSISAKGQIIQGKILDANTEEPVAFANVFFSGTLVGTTSNINGEFFLKHRQTGTYDLVVSYVGYKEFLQTIDASKSIEMKIMLKPEVIQLSDVLVNADTSNWKNNYNSFKSLFLGRTKNASKANILNPRDIFLFYDKVENGLFAHCKNEIIIENEALGYRMIYRMKKFENYYRTGELRSFGIPRFETLKARSKRQEKRWRKERNRSYFGSIEHFLTSVITNDFIDEGFVVRTVFKVQNRERPPQELIDSNMAKFAKPLNMPGITLGSNQEFKVDSLTNLTDTAPEKMRRAYDSLRDQGFKPRAIRMSKNNFQLSDSLLYWSRANRMPLYVDSLGTVLKDNELLINQNDPHTISYIGTLRVVYTKEAEEDGFASMRVGGGVDKKQTSDISIKEPFTISRNGYYDVNKLFFSGYWAWSSRIAEMLPLGYKPETLD